MGARRGRGDCAKGVVTGGFSQGAILALLARNDGTRVAAARGMGLLNRYGPYDLRSCLNNGKRKLEWQSEHPRREVEERRQALGVTREPLVGEGLHTALSARRAPDAHQRNIRGPSAVPTAVGSAIPAVYHSATNGAAISGQCRQ